ncbi:MAG TPA: GerAB/ArcD/ProY family transporter, partial [Candidatus Udaeobacter sp.]|nr:GerAB/ArcD/ProY family transporter [Candidatus Udaeobacter sp.]
NNGAWLSLLLSGGLGFLLLSCMLFLYRRFPDMTYVEFSRQLIGTTLTAIFSVFTMSLFLQMEAGIVIDVSLFMVSSMLRETPMYVFSFLVYAISAATARAGIEVMARMFTLILIMITFSIIAVLLVAIPDYHPSNLLPIMPKGIKPVFHGAFLSFGFPYAEVFLFSMLFPFVDKSSSSKLCKTMRITLGFNIFILCLSTVCAIMVFGAYAGERPYVLFSLARVIEFQEIIQRMESIIGMSLILGSYMKTTITLYVFSLFLSQLCGFKDNRAVVMPLALLGFLTGLVAFDGAAEWGFIVSAVHPVWTYAAFIAPLLVLTVTALVRKQEQPKGKGQT